MEKQNVLSIGLLSDDRPAVFFDMNNGHGTFLYNHNIREVLVIKDKEGGFTTTESKNEATGTMFQYDSLRCEYPKTGDNVFATLLTAKYPSQTESKLWNEYKSAELGLLDVSFKKPYEDFLKDRLSIRSSVNTDCETCNIPLNYE